ncbi:MAG: type II secretion system F family protein [Suilimivivens sp.]
MWKSLKQRALENEEFISVSLKEKLLLYGKSISVVLLINYCFYQSPVAFLPLFIPGFFFYRMEEKELLHKKKEDARQQFKEMLLLTVAGQKAGYSVENAFLKSYEDLANLYGRESSICRMLKELETGLINSCKASDLWKSIGDKIDISEIKEFAAVFAIAKESGGNMTSIMERTAENIGSRAETQKEIETLLSARKLEQKIMNVMPFFLMLYINVTSPGYFSGLYHSFQGAVIMTICLVVYLLAYLLGVKIAVIEV